jgi:hypothetical protein
MGWICEQTLSLDENPSDSRWLIFLRPARTLAFAMLRLVLRQLWTGGAFSANVVRAIKNLVTNPTRTSARRAVQPRPTTVARAVELPRIGGLSHRYEWREAA